MQLLLAWKSVEIEKRGIEANLRFFLNQTWLPNDSGTTQLSS
jgi:hypothetical protein